MDFGKTINYPFRDEKWVTKILIGTFVSLIPIVNFITYGYMLRIVKQVIQGDDESMPEWDDWGGDFIKGLLAWLASMLYFLPMILMICCFAILSALTTNDNGEGLGVLFALCLVPLSLGYSLLVSPLLAVAYVRYAESNNFASAFLDFGGLFKDVTSQLTKTITFILFLLVIQAVVGAVVGFTIWLCGLGLLVAWVGNVMTAHLAGQYGKTLREVA